MILSHFEMAIILRDRVSWRRTSRAACVTPICVRFSTSYVVIVTNEKPARKGPTLRSLAQSTVAPLTFVRRLSVAQFLTISSPVAHSPHQSFMPRLLCATALLACFSVAGAHSMPADDGPVTLAGKPVHLSNSLRPMEEVKGVKADPRARLDQFDVAAEKARKQSYELDSKDSYGNIKDSRKFDSFDKASEKADLHKTMKLGTEKKRNY